MYIEDNECCCGTCKYHGVNTNDKGWICKNELSEYFSDYTTYEDNCGDYERRRRDE